MTALAIAIVVVACLWVLDRQAIRHAVEREKDRVLLDRLADRIQNPDRVQPGLDAEPSDRPLYVSPFDDDGFNELKAG